MWEAPEHRPDPVALLERDDEGRLPELLPIRYDRMLQSPFAFYRGAASIMASDLQSTPASGIATQICGDAHLLNFGAFATAERRFVFDVNDFDETTAGAWEWDVKRLATSFAIAARHLGFRARDARAAVLASVRSYRERTNAYADTGVLDVWYARIDEDVVAGLVAGSRSASFGAPRDNDAHVWPTLARAPDGAVTVADKPPHVFHPPDAAAYEDHVRGLFRAYARSLPTERRRLFERYRFVDAAYKVVGVGSVGTRCSVALFVANESDGNDTLWLQTKEARASVYERYAATTAANHGERVVVGQRLQQTSSDIFLGWALADDGRAFYVRQLHDMKTSPNVDAMTPRVLESYATACGWALARAHARAGGKAREVSGYLGQSA
ncbi:MAG: DUF2252 domain-containing protein, partial [Candidatus Eremiobacteraeota bacterium]|nr:DUF2252 domain-containing protein [Candidatus Eremiobacteraeota bacterium]